MSRLKRLIREIHERSLWQALVVYLGASFAVLEAVDLFIGYFALPRWLFTVAFSVLVVGLLLLVGASLASKEVYGEEVRPEDLEAAAEEDRRLRLLTWRKAATSFVVALALWGVVAAGWLLYPSTTIPFDERDWILIADLQNETGDSVFEGSLNTALAVGLQQSRHINVIPRSRVAQTLKRMQREGDEPLSEAEWREVALRENVRLLVVPGIDRVDSLYMLTIRSVDPATGSDLKSRSARALGKTEVLESLDKLVRQLRRDLGESMFALAQDGAQLDRVTTPSLEALSLYSRARRAYNTRNRDEAVILYERAIELDSSFAMAHAGLGIYHLWQEDRIRGDHHLNTALALVDRLSERERHSIEADAHMWRQNYEAAISAYRILVERYPDDMAAWVNLGNAYMRLDRQEEAIATLSRALELDSTDAGLYINIATSYNSLGKHADALSYYLRAFELEPAWRTSGNLNHEFGFNYVGMGDLESAERTFTDMLSGSDEQRAGGHRSLALLLMYTGRYGEAIDHLTRAATLRQSLGHWTSETRDRLYLAAAFAAIGAARDFHTQIARAWEIGRSSQLAPWWLMLLGKLQARSGLVVEAEETLDTLEARLDENNRYDKIARHVLTGEVALAEQRIDEAIRELETAYAVQGASYWLEGLAFSYLAAGDLQEARSRYEEMIERAEFGVEAQEYWFRAHRQLGQIHELLGDTARAIEYYQRLFELWRAGDDDLVALINARERLHALRGPG